MNRIVATSVVTLLVLIGGCGKESAPTASSSKPAAVAAPDPMVVKPEASVLARLSVEEIAERFIAHALRVPGRIEFNEFRVARIGANATGRITEVVAHRGQPVRIGQILAHVYSNELGAAQFELLKARSQADLLERAAGRARQLYEADVIGLAELQRRENELSIARAEVRSATNQLKVLGMTDAETKAMLTSGEIHSKFSVQSTMNGIVVDRQVTRGQVVQPSDALFTVADLSTVWVIADVPEQESSSLAVGQSVQIEVPALPAEPLKASLDYVDAIVDPETRTVLIRSELDNREGLLKPAMLATLVIEGPREKALVIPAEAVVNEEGRNFVFVDAGSGRFRLTEVTLDDDNEGARVVRAGLKPGQKIVVKGSFHLNSERKRRELEGSQ
ncbi:MAG: efflux RND transporter periplasmic adaptor subunit [Betaproteobacteria bacterium]